MKLRARLIVQLTALIRPKIVYHLRAQSSNIYQSGFINFVFVLNRDGGQNKQFAYGHAVIFNAELQVVPEKQYASELSVLYNEKFFVLAKCVIAYLWKRRATAKYTTCQKKNSRLCSNCPRVRIHQNHNPTRLLGIVKKTLCFQWIAKFVNEVVSLFAVITSIV